jgi:hypothetical protein
MAKRELTKDEKDLTQRQIEKLFEDNEDARYICDFNKLQIERGLKRKYLQDVREAERRIKECLNIIEVNNSTITELNSQLKEGVESKNG